MRLLAAVAILLAAVPVQARAPSTQPIAIGSSHRIDSVPLAEERNINVVLPASYANEPTRRYPIIYVIDGGIEQDLLHVAGAAHLGAMWGRTQEAIVVGIETGDRRRELVGPTSDPELLKRYPTAGSSAAFRRFIRDEVKPLVEGNYRANGEDLLIGESLAGLFVVETLIEEPGLFDGYAAIDPSLWWDKQALSKTVASKVGAAQKDKRAFLAMGREQTEEPAAMQRIVEALRRSGTTWCLSDRSDLTHATIYQQVTPQAFQFLLPPGEAPPPEFGFEVQCSPKS